MAEYVTVASISPFSIMLPMVWSDDVLEADSAWRLEARGRALAPVSGALHVPVHVGRLEAEVVFQDAAGPQRLPFAIVISSEESDISETSTPEHSTEVRR
jgi:hypothetical protein